MPAVVEIARIILVSICLLFKADVDVCRHPVTVNNQPDDPFQPIEDIEEDEKKFQFLGEVDVLMPLRPFVESLSAILPDEAP